MLRTPLEFPPDVLAQKSREVALNFGYTRKPADFDQRLDHRRPLIAYLNRQPEPRNWNDWLASEAPITSTYREALGTLESMTGPPPGGPGGRDVPALTRPGMVYVVLEGRGKLREFAAVPYEAPATTPNPDAIFSATGFDRSKFKQVQPDFVPTYAADTIQLWNGPHPVLPNMTIEIQMGWWKGMVTHVRVLYPYRSRDEDPRVQRSWIWKIRGNVLFLSTIIGIIFVLLLARRNWKLGRTDRKGAVRVATAKFLAGMVVWLGTVHAVQSERMIFSLLDGASEWILVSVMIWLLTLR